MTFVQEEEDTEGGEIILESSTTSGVDKKETSGRESQIDDVGPSILKVVASRLKSV